MIALEEVTRDTLRDVLRLKVAPDQEDFVAPNAVSIAQAYFEPEAWFRAICAQGAHVGFVMLIDPTLPGAEPRTTEKAQDIYLWRLMIAADHQGKGYGRATLDAILDHARTRPGIKRVTASYVPEPGGPEAFYLGYGFEKTGQVHDGEVVIALSL